MSGPIQSPAEALVAVITSIGLDAELWEPPTIRPPMGTVGTPSVRRTPPDQAESQLSTNDWYVDYLVSLYFDITRAQAAQQRMVTALIDFTEAIDADPSLAGTVFEAAVTSAEPFFEDGRNRPLIGYQITVATLSLINPDSL